MIMGPGARGVSAVSLALSLGTSNVYAQWGIDVTRFCEGARAILAQLGPPAPPPPPAIEGGPSTAPWEATIERAFAALRAAVAAGTNEGMAPPQSPHAAAPPPSSSTVTIGAGSGISPPEQASQPPPLPPPPPAAPETSLGDSTQHDMPL